MAESRAYLRQHGQRLAGKVPYGYDAELGTKQLLVNNSEAPLVGAMFEMAAEGLPPSRIVAIVNERGWTTRISPAKRSAKAIGGGLFAHVVFGASRLHRTALRFTQYPDDLFLAESTLFHFVLLF